MWIYVLVVFVMQDAQWRDWSSYYRLQECQEVLEVITRHKQGILEAGCERRWVEAIVEEECSPNGSCRVKKLPRKKLR